jgi:uncharacterized protein YndB with AHSA1/START domain
MTTEASATAVQTSVTVNAPIEQAFRTFTEDFDRVKPRDHTMLDAEIEKSVFEPRVGGRVYDLGIDGSECQWGRVLACEPPERVVFTWDISAQWELEQDLEKTSEVEVRFIAETADRTRVELQHRNLNRHVEGWEALRESVSGEGGWPLYLRRLAEAARA